MDELKRIMSLGFEETVSRVTGALSAKGFGILTEVDIQQTFRKKLNADFRPYKILGACNPTMAAFILGARERALDKPDECVKPERLHQVVVRTKSACLQGRGNRSICRHQDDWPRWVEPV